VWLNSTNLCSTSVCGSAPRLTSTGHTY